MTRYLNSFLITLVLYAGVFFALFVIFADDKIILKKEKPRAQTISLKHIELFPAPKPEKKPEKKLEKKPEKKVEKTVEKKLVEKVQKKIKKPKVIKKSIVKKKEPKKIVKKKLIKKPEKKKVIKKSIEEKKNKIKKVVTEVQKEIKKEPIKQSIVKQSRPKEIKKDIQKEYLSKHLSMIRAYIKKNVHYPKSAKRLKIQGIVTVKFTLRSSGVVDNIVIINGHSRLKKSTINAVKDAGSSFPKIKKDITIQLPIEYKLI